MKDVGQHQETDDDVEDVDINPDVTVRPDGVISSQDDRWIDRQVAGFESAGDCPPTSDDAANHLADLMATRDKLEVIEVLANDSIAAKLVVKLCSFIFVLILSIHQS